MDHTRFAFETERRNARGDAVGRQAFKTIQHETRANLRRCLHQLIAPEGRPDLDGLRRLGQLLHEQLLPPEIRSQLDEFQGPLVISSEDLALPWELLHDGHECLCLRRPLSRHVQLHFGTGETSSSEPIALPGRALIIANPEKGTEFDLPNSEREAVILAELLGKIGIHVTLLIGPQCTWDRVLDELRRPDFALVHLAGHIRKNDGKSNGEYAFCCADGRMLKEEIVSSFRCHALVFLSGCYADALERDRSREPLDPAVPSHTVGASSLTTAFLASPGCRGVIGTQWWVADDIAFDVSECFYREAFAGAPVGAALHSARKRVYDSAADPALWASYVHYGDPELAFRGISAGAKTSNRDNPPAATPPVLGKKSESDTEAHSPREVEEGASRESADRKGPLNGGAAAVSVPFDASGRLCLLNAFQEQQETLWPIVSTIHLLIGMLRIPEGLTGRLLRRMHIPGSLLADALRQAFTKQAPSQTDWSGPVVGRNLARLLEKASQSAQLVDSQAIGETHLLDALLSTPDTGAYKLLDITLQAIGKSGKTLSAEFHEFQMIRSVFDADGRLVKDHFTSRAFMVIEQAKTEAGLTRWRQIRSPHLAVAVLSHPDSDVCLHLRRKNVTPGSGEIIRFFRRGFQPPTQEEGEGPAELNAVGFSKNAVDRLLAAARLAQARGSPHIDECDIWRAVLDDPTDFFVRVVQQLRIWPVSLLPVGW